MEVPTIKQLQASVASTISKIESMSDGGLRLRVDTQELNPTAEWALMQLRGKIGWFCFSESEPVVPSEAPSVTDKTEGKSQSQRIRSRLYVLFSKLVDSGKTQLSFEQFYQNETGKVFHQISERIDELEPKL